jgi:hypothetical protein
MGMRFDVKGSTCVHTSIATVMRGIGLAYLTSHTPLAPPRLRDTQRAMSEEPQHPDLVSLAQPKLSIVGIG